MHSFYVFGTGNIFRGLGGYFSSKKITAIVFSRHSIRTTHRRTIRLRDKEGIYQSYTVLFIADNVPSHIIESLITPDIWIYIVNIYHHKSLLENKKDLVILSCCRDGLCSTYAPILTECNCGGTIVAIDNDKSIAGKAQVLLPKFKVNSAVIDMYCPGKPEVDNKSGMITAYVSRVSSIVFPPDCEEYKKYFRVSLSSSLFVTFTKDEDEYDIYKMEKLYNVNIPHTTMALLAWAYFDFASFNEWKFSDIPLEKYEKLKQLCLDIHRDYCYPWVVRRANILGGDEPNYIAHQYDVYANVASARLSELHESDDTLSRIINPTSKSSLSKLENHMDHLKVCHFYRLLYFIKSHLI